MLSFNFLRQSRTENEEIPSAVHMIIIGKERGKYVELAWNWRETCDDEGGETAALPKESKSF